MSGQASADLKEVIDSLNGSKQSFLNDVEHAICSHVEGQGKNCLTLVERDPHQQTILRTIEPATTAEYVSLLVKFCRGERHQGRVLDSGLTESIVERVAACYAKLYQDRAEQVATAFMAVLLANQTVLKSFLRALTERLAREAGAQVKDKIIHLLIHQLKEAAQSQTGRAITSTIQHSAAATTAAAVAKTLASLLIKAMGTQIKFLIVKLLTTAAAKKIIMVAVKKFVAAAILGALIKLIAAKLGLGTTGAMMIVLLPIIAAFIGYEIYHFPKQLGVKVAHSVRAELDGKFDEINANLLETLFDEMFRVRMDDLVGAIAGDADIRRSVEQLAASV